MAFTPKFPWFPNIDTFFPRNNIWKHIQNSTPYFKGTMLDVGCGVMPYRNYIKEHGDKVNYIGLDLEVTEIYSDSKPDITWDAITIPLEPNSIDSVLITEVLEHCPDPIMTLTEVCRVTKTGAPIVFSVPFHWTLHESPWDFYRYTPFALEKIFKDAGLKIETMHLYGNGDAAFLHAYFIWLKRGYLPKMIRFFIYLISLPFILLFLLLCSKKYKSTFENGDSFIGIVGVGRKV